MRMKPLLLATTLGLLVGGLWLFWPTSGTTTAPIKEGTRASVDVAGVILGRSRDQQFTVGASGDGAGLYATHCAACHGDNLEGMPNWQSLNDDGSLRAPPHDDTGHTWHHGDKALIEYTKKGGQRIMADAGLKDFKSAMPAFESVLTDQQIAQILAFIKTKWSNRNQKVQRDRTRAEDEVVAR